MLDDMVTENGYLSPFIAPKMKRGVYFEAKQAALAAEKQQWFHNPPSLRTRDQIINAGLYDQEIFRTIPKSNVDLTRKYAYREKQISEIIGKKYRRCFSQKINTRNRTTAAITRDGRIQNA
jgi:hypothetical protein